MQLSDQPILLIHPSRVNIIIAFTSGQEGVTGKVARFAYGHADMPIVDARADEG